MKKGLFFLVCGILGLFSLFFYFYSALESFSTVFIHSYGYFGLLVLVILMDTLIQPLSPDILVFGSTLAGLDLFGASLIGGLASCLAGVFGYSIGSVIGEHGFSKCT